MGRSATVPAAPEEVSMRSIDVRTQARTGRVDVVRDHAGEELPA